MYSKFLLFFSIVLILICSCEMKYAQLSILLSLVEQGKVAA